MHLVDEGDGVGQRELQPAATAAAAAAAEEAAASAAAAAEAAAAAGGASRLQAADRRRRRRRRPCDRSAALDLAAAARPKPNCARIWSITACDGRRDFSGLREIEAEPKRVLARAVEIDRPQVDADQTATDASRMKAIREGGLRSPT